MPKSATSPNQLLRLYATDALPPFILNGVPLTTMFVRTQLQPPNTSHFGVSCAPAIEAASGANATRNIVSKISVRRIDDDVAEALYSKNRMVPTYTKSQII